MNLEYRRSGQARVEKKNISWLFLFLFSVVNGYMTYIQYTYFGPFNHEILSQVLPRPSTSYWSRLPREMNENVEKPNIVEHGSEVKTNLSSL